MFNRGIKKNCLNPECTNNFYPKIDRQIYCSKKCYYELLKIKKKQCKNAKPKFICPDCNKITFLDFSPIKNKKRWADWSCGHCGYINETSLYYKELIGIEKELQKEEKDEILLIAQKKKIKIYKIVLKWWIKIRR